MAVGPQTSPDLSLSVPRLGPALPVSNKRVVFSTPSEVRASKASNRQEPQELQELQEHRRQEMRAQEMRAQEMRAQEMRSQEMRAQEMRPREMRVPEAKRAFRSKNPKELSRDREPPKFELKDLKEPMTPADWSGSLRRSKPPPKRRSLNWTLEEFSAQEHRPQVSPVSTTISPFVKKKKDAVESMPPTPSVPLVDSTASDGYAWPSEQFEPLGSMIRSLEFQVGALFELMDAHSDADPSVLDVIDRKREAVHDTFQALKEAVWWTRRRERPRRERVIMEGGALGRGEGDGLVELEALETQLDLRISQVLEAADAPEPARRSSLPAPRATGTTRRELQVREASLLPKGPQVTTQTTLEPLTTMGRDGGAGGGTGSLVLTPTYFHFRTDE